MFQRNISLASSLKGKPINKSALAGGKLILSLQPEDGGDTSSETLGTL
jgi:hypothetical protein